MHEQDSEARQPRPAAKGLDDCESNAPNPPIKRWVVWNDETEDWDLDDSPSPKSGMKKPIVLDHDSGGHEIQFHLTVPGGSRWQFDTNDPIWTADNVGCGSLSCLASDQVSVLRPESHRLVVFDKNLGDKRIVRYQLNFVGAPGGPVPPACDPTILNGGGTRA